MATNRFWIWTAAVGLIFAPHAMAGMLIGSASNSIYDIDPVTGLASNPRPTSHTFNLTFAGDVLYGTAGQSLYTLDVASGQATLVGGLNLGSLIFSRDIAWDAANQRLLGLFWLGGTSGAILYDVDPLSLDATVIGLMDKEYWSLSFTETGRLHAIGRSADVVDRIDLVDGSTLSGTVLSSPVPRSAFISPDGSGNLFLLSLADDRSSALSVLDPITGALSPVGDTGAGIVFSSLAYIPEPGSFVLVIIGAFTLLRRRTVTS